MVCVLVSTILRKCINKTVQPTRGKSFSQLQFRARQWASRYNRLQPHTTLPVEWGVTVTCEEILPTALRRMKIHTSCSRQTRSCFSKKHGCFVCFVPHTEFLPHSIYVSNVTVLGGGNTMWSRVITFVKGGQPFPPQVLLGICKNTNGTARSERVFPAEKHAFAFLKAPYWEWQLVIQSHLVLNST